MNKIFKKIWNRSRGCFVAVSEATSTANQSIGKAALVTAVSALILSPTEAAYVIKHLEGNEPFSGTYGDYNTRWHGSGTVTMNGEYYGAWVELCGDNGHSDRDELRISAPGVFHISDTFQHGKYDGERDIFHNDGLLDLVGDAKYIYLHSRDDSLTGSGTINGGHILFQKDQNITQGKITNFRSFQLVDSGVTVNSLSGSNLTLDANSRFDINGQSKITNINNSGTIRTSTLEMSGTYSGNGALSVGNSATLRNAVINALVIIGGNNSRFSIASSLNLNGSQFNQGVRQNAGTVAVIGGTNSINQLDKTGGVLSNSGSLSVVNFNQTSGSASNSGNLTVGHADLYGSLNNTGTLTLTGNVTSRGNLSSSGTLNNRGNWTETNRFTIAGNLNNTGSVNFQNGFQFGNGRLTSSGTIQTNNALDVFDSLGTTGRQDLNYVSLNSSVPQEVKTSLTDFFLKYVPGTVAKNLVDHASFTGGKVVITGVNLTQTQADDLAKAFKTKFFRLSPNVSTSTVSVSAD